MATKTGPTEKQLTQARDAAGEAYYRFDTILFHLADCWDRCLDSKLSTQQKHRIAIQEFVAVITSMHGYVGRFAESFTSGVQALLESANALKPVVAFGGGEFATYHAGVLRLPGILIESLNPDPARFSHTVNINSAHVEDEPRDGYWAEYWQAVFARLGAPDMPRCDNAWEHLRKECAAAVATMRHTHGANRENDQRPDAAFRFQDGLFSISYQGQTVFRKPAKSGGYHYLQHLLLNPCRGFTADELMQVASQCLSLTKDQILNVVRFNDEFENDSDSAEKGIGVNIALDGDAIKSYHKRLKQIAIERQQAEAKEDEERIAELNAEVRIIERQLPFKGKDRGLPNDLRKKAEKVRKALERVIDSFKADHGVLYSHLREMTDRNDPFVYKATSTTWTDKDLAE